MPRAFASAGRMPNPNVARGQRDAGFQPRNITKTRMKKRTLLSWSSGKDSAWALYELRQSPDIEVVGLVTTVNQAYDRVAMHAVRSDLLRCQADAVGLPLHVLPIPYPCSNAQYEAIMDGFVAETRAQGVECMAFGDLYLEGIRRYREDRLKDTGIAPVFPLWQRPTDQLIEQMLTGGLRAWISCVDPKHLAPGFAGRRLDRALLDELPDKVDPCGENGEFHTFAVDGPMFRRPVDVRVGEIVERDGFVFADLMPEISAGDAHEYR